METKEMKDLVLECKEKVDVLHKRATRISAIRRKRRFKQWMKIHKN